MTRGILLIAFGHSSYGKWAFNMAHSIKQHSSFPVTLVTDATDNTMAGVDLSIFDKVSYQVFNRKENGSVDAAAAKIRMGDFSSYDQTIYLDVDGICLKDITNLFDRIFLDCHVYSQVLGKGGKEDSISYSLWASNETIWSHYNLKPDAVMPAVQSSIVAFDKSKESEQFFKALKENYTNKIPDDMLQSAWGESKSQPDELYFNVTFAQLGLIPDESIQPILFPKEHTNKLSEINEKYWILSMWGARDMARPFAKDYYDRLMHKCMSEQGRAHYYKCHDLYKHKFLGQK